MQIIGRDGVYYYHDMIEEMIKWGYEEGKTLFGFGYDFRQSNRYVFLKLSGTCDIVLAEIFSIPPYCEGLMKQNSFILTLIGLKIKGIYYTFCYTSIHKLMQRFYKGH